MNRINNQKLFWIIILILPLIDTFNGMLNGGGNEGGLSLGILYRMIVLVFIVFQLFNNMPNRKVTIIFFVILISAAISMMLDADNLKYFSEKILRLFLPIIIVLAIESQNRFNIIDSKGVHQLFSIWSYLFPLTILVPFVFGLGFSTYGTGTAGYKAFYFAQNDIGFILAALYLFVIFELNEEITATKLVAVLLLLTTNFLLGLKSNYLYVVTITLLYLLKKSRKFTSQILKFLVFGLIIAATMIIFRYHSDLIMQIVNRWQFFYDRRSFMSFWTSARSDRIIPAFYWLKETKGVIGMIFGTGMDYSFHTVGNYSNVIEMDAVDLFFQFGIIGLCAIYYFYLRIPFRYRAKGFYFWGFWLSIITGLFAGHIMESALSGMFFAMICSGAIIEFRKGNGINEKQTKTVEN